MYTSSLILATIAMMGAQTEAINLTAMHTEAECLAAGLPANCGQDAAAQAGSAAASATSAAAGAAGAAAGSSGAAAGGAAASTADGMDGCKCT